MSMAPALVHVAALALRASATVCPASPTCPQDDKCAFSANGASFEVDCATDYYGGDLQLARTPTLAACISVCSSTNGCVAISYVGENCYMKSTLNSARTNNAVIGAYVTTRESVTPVPQTNPSTTQSCPASYSCPKNDGCMLSGADARSFSLSCSVDFYGGDLTSLYTTSLASCTQACLENAQCVAASYVGGSGAGYCYLKDHNNGKVANYNVDGISLVTSVTPSPSPTPSVVPSFIVSSSSMLSTVVASSSSTAGLSSTIQSSSSDRMSSSATSSTGATSSTSTPLSSSASVSSPTPLMSTSSTVSSIPSPTPLNSQLLLNTGFEDGIGAVATPWYLNPNYNSVTSVPSGRVFGNAHGGEYSYQFGPTNSRGSRYQVSQNVTVVPGQAYDVSYWLKGNSAASCTTSTYINLSQPSGTTGDLRSVGVTYQRGLVRFSSAYISSRVASSSSTTVSVSVAVSCDFAGAGKYIYLDDVTMTQVVS